MVEVEIQVVFFAGFGSIYSRNFRLGIPRRKDRHLEMLRRSQAKCHLSIVKLILGCCKTSDGYHIEEV